MSTTINLTTKNNTKKTTRAITGVNPQATEDQIRELAYALDELSDNELINIEKVEKTAIDLD